MPAPYTDEWIDTILGEYPPLLTKREYAHVTRRSARTIERQVAAGLIPAIRATEGGSSRVLIAREIAARELRRMAGRAA